MKGPSNLQNLVTRIMWFAIALAATSPMVLFYAFYAESTEPTPEPVPLVFKIDPPERPTTFTQSSYRTPSAPAQPSVAGEKEDRPAADPLPESPAPFSVPVLEEPSSILTSSAVLPEVYEKPVRNGTPGTAQEITECTLIGKRGSEEDRADYYKIQATAETMVLQLDSSSADIPGFRLSVLDQRQRFVEEGAEETAYVSVKPQDTYYVILDLADAPIAPPQYKLHIRFEDVRQSRNLTFGEANPYPEGL